MKTEFQYQVELFDEKFTLTGKVDLDDWNEYGCDKPELISISRDSINPASLSRENGEKYSDWLNRAITLVEDVAGEYKNEIYLDMIAPRW